MQASWELLSTDDIGPGTQPATRRIKVRAVVHLPSGEMRFVATRLDMTPEQMAVWVEAMHGKQVDT